MLEKVSLFLFFKVLTWDVGVSIRVQSKYDKLTPLATLMRDDPSCQLLIVLKQYVRSVGLDHVRNILASDNIPETTTLQKGLQVLTRQWKNKLYMPSQVPLKGTRKKTTPFTVTFAMPSPQEDEESLDRFGKFQHAMDCFSVNPKLMFYILSTNVRTLIFLAAVLRNLICEHLQEFWKKYQALIVLLLLSNIFSNTDS